MSQPTFVAATSSDTQIVIEWTLPSGTATGGSSITCDTYTVEHRPAAGSWITVAPAFAHPVNTATITGLTAGTTYEFVVYAHNKYGNGPTQTTPLSVTAGQAPNALLATDVSTTVPANSVDVKIYWNAPTTTTGFTVDSYQILIKKSDNTYYEDLTYCDGSTPAVVTNRYCLVPMSILRAAPYSLAYGNSVIAQVRSHNSRGWSSLSPDSTTVATVATEPTQMASPAKGSSTSESQIQVTWTALSTALTTGGSTVLSYNLQWDSGTN